MTPIKVIKSWHAETCSPSLCQPIHLPSSSPAHITAHLAPLHTIICCTTSALLPSLHLSLRRLTLPFMPSCAFAPPQAFKRNMTSKNQLNAPLKKHLRDPQSNLLSQTQQWKGGAEARSGRRKRGVREGEGMQARS